LHNYSIVELIDLKNSTNSKYTRLALTAITMRYQGYSNSQIIETTNMSKVSIVAHIKDWNIHGIKSVEDQRGGNRPTSLTPRMVDDLNFVVLNKKPTDYNFIGHTWTCSLLVLYVKHTYGINVSTTTIWETLKSKNLSYKRAQAKPTKANKADQEAFKKNFSNTRYFRVFL
jgi:transposase